jgi:potassium-transporting ATPase KdpC subunit
LKTKDIDSDDDTVAKITKRIRGGNIRHLTLDNIGPSIKVIILMLIVTGIAYPLILVAIGQNTFPFQSNGSIVTLNGKAIGSQLIAQEFNSSKLFHPRPASDSASGLDPHITPTSAFSQISNISKASGIPENAVRTLVELNIERNKNNNFLAFAPDYVNVLELNMELIQQYPEAYGEFVNIDNNNNTLHSGR